MNSFYSIKLNKSSNIPLYQQLGDCLCELIENGILFPGTKLPPIRKLANKLKINNVTVINAYKYLENKKVVYSKIGSGTYVSELSLNDTPIPIQNQRKNLYTYTQLNNNSINFADTSVSAELFPVSKFKLIFNEILDRDKGNAFSYQYNQGYEPLRIALCNYIENIGIKTFPDRIQIISGAQQGIDIISKVMLSQGDIVFVEKPTYYGAIGAILSRGAKIIEIPMEEDGINLKMLKNFLNLYTPKYIYIMTYYQTPTCISYSIEKKRELLEIAYKYNIYIIEEDNLSDFNYSDNPIITLKALDYKNKVIYIKSFSKILMPGLRLGYMVLPKIISNNVLSAKYSTDISTSSFFQRAFELYFRNGEWDNHINKMKNIFKQKYTLTLNSVIKYLNNYVTFKEPEGGLCFWLKINNNKINIENFINILVKKNVIVTPGSIFSISGEENSPYIRISFSNIENKDIEKGIKILGEVFNYFNLY